MFTKCALPCKSIELFVSFTYKRLLELADQVREVEICCMSDICGGSNATEEDDDVSTNGSIEELGIFNESMDMPAVEDNPAVVLVKPRREDLVSRELE